MKRLDREGAYTIPLWVGLLLSGLFIVWSPQVDPLISDGTENLLGLALAVGAGVCLAGTVVRDRIRAYQIEWVGLLITVIVLAAVGMKVDRSVLEQFTMYGSLGAIIQIGSIRLMFLLGREVLANRPKKLQP